MTTQEGDEDAEDGETDDVAEEGTEEGAEEAGEAEAAWAPGSRRVGMAVLN